MVQTKRRLRKSELQDHFQYQKLYSSFMKRPEAEDMAQEGYFVTDSSGKTAKAGSKNEYFVAQALRTVGLKFQFQLSIAGGRSLAFGIVLDFLVETAPLPTPLWVHGEHWHMGERRAKDLRQQDIVKEYMRGSILEPVEIWGSESDTQERALSAVRKKLR
jgi:hypothetical protein